MKFSLQEIKEENLAKSNTSIPLPPATVAIVKYEPKIPPPRPGGTCYKHITLSNNCAKLGIQRTRSKRWGNQDDHYSQSESFLSHKNHSVMEKLYQEARMAFHREPCTCPTTK
jgi:hypothetical protein